MLRSRGIFTNYYRKFPGDYARDTRHLSLAEHGAYNLLLDHLYATEKPIPTLEAAWKICQVSTKMRTRGPTSGQKLVMYVLTNFFVFGQKGYTHKRVDEEISYAESRSKAARQSAEARWRKDANAMPTQCERNALQTPDSRQPEAEADRLFPNLTLMQKLGISLSLWAHFKRMREKIRRPIVQGAEDLIFSELVKLQEQGESPIEVLEQAIRTSSYGLYPVRKDKKNGESFSERQHRQSTEALDRVDAHLDAMDAKVVRRLPNSSRQ